MYARRLVFTVSAMQDAKQDPVVINILQKQVKVTQVAQAHASLLTEEATALTESVAAAAEAERTQKLAAAAKLAADQKKAALLAFSEKHIAQLAAEQSASQELTEAMDAAEQTPKNDAADAVKFAKSKSFFAMGYYQKSDSSGPSGSGAMD